MVPLAPHEFPEFHEADLLHLDARVGLDAPQKVWAAPGSQVMAASGVPEKANLLHGAIIPKGAGFYYGATGSSTFGKVLSQDGDQKRNPMTECRAFSPC